MSDTTATPDAQQSGHDLPTLVFTPPAVSARTSSMRRPGTCVHERLPTTNQVGSDPWGEQSRCSTPSTTQR